MLFLAIIDNKVGLSASVLIQNSSNTYDASKYDIWLL